MKEFPIYRVIGGRMATRTEKSGMEIVVLTVRNIGGSVNRHVEMVDGQWVGRHPDYYHGVNAKNIRAEDMFAKLENDLEKLTQKLERLDVAIAQWVEQSRFEEMTLETAKDCAESRFNLDPASVQVILESLRPLVIQKLKKKMNLVRAEAIDVGVNKEYAQRYLAEVQRDFPRLVAYVHQK